MTTSGRAASCREANARAQRFDVMAVDFGDAPAERAPFFRQRLDRRDRRDRAVDLRIIGVDHGDQAVEPLMRGEHRRLPHLAFFHLAVAEKCKRVAILAGKPRRQGKTDRARQTLTERTADQIAQRRALAADGLQRRLRRCRRRRVSPDRSVRSRPRRHKARSHNAQARARTGRGHSACRRRTAPRKSRRKTTPARDSRSPGSRPSRSRECECAPQGAAALRCRGRMYRRPCTHS